MEEVDKKLVKGIVEFEIMKILWSGPIHVKDIGKKLEEALEIGVDSETITKTLELMETNGYVNTSKGLRKNYVLTSKGKSLFEDTWQSLNFYNHITSDGERLAKWLSLYLASRKIWISEQMIENSIGNYQAEETLKKHLIIT